MPGVRKIKVSSESELEVEGLRVVNFGPTIVPQRDEEKPEAGAIFISTHGWTNSGSGGTTATDDTADFVFGDRSIKLENNAELHTSQSATRETGLTLNMTGRYFIVYVKVDDIDGINQLRLQGSSDGFSNFREWRIDDDKTFIKAGDGWTRISLPWSHGQDSGTGLTRASIAELQFKFTSNNTNNIVRLGAVHSAPEPANGVCSLCFDDGYDSINTKANAKMSEYGYRGTAFIIPSAVGTGTAPTARASLQTLKDLQNINGWDISAHDNVRLDTISIDQADKRLRDVKGYLIKNGLTQGADLYAYPNGVFNDAIIARAKKYYSACRSIVEHRSKETSNPPADAMKLRIINITDNDVVATIDTRVQEARDNNEWIICVFHNIVDSVTAPSTQISTADFNTIIDNINTSAIPVKPISQVLRDGA